MNFLKRCLREIFEIAVTIIGWVYYTIQPHAFKWAALFLLLCVLPFVTYKKFNFAFYFDLVLLIMCIIFGLARNHRQRQGDS